MATLTDRIGGLFRKMRLSRPAHIDIHAPETEASPDSSADALKRLADGEVALDLHEAPTDIDAESHAPDDTAERGSTGGGLLSRLPGRKRDAAIAQLREDYGEVMHLIRDVRRHLDGQAQRSDRLLDLLDGLPDALRSIPESNRNQARMLETLGTHLERTHQSSAQLNSAVKSLASATEHQSQTLGVLQEQIHSSRKTDEQMLASFGAMSRTLENLNTTSRQSSTALQAVTDQTANSEERLRDLIKQNGKQMMWLSAISWTLAAVALGLAVFVAITAAG